jgi:hypothetical protein
MRIGIISEGPADIAVITNILKGVTGIDSNDIVPIRPLLKFDNTHLAHLDPGSFSTWSLVKEECVERKKIEQFLSLDDSTHVVIHVDTAEASNYGITLPSKKDHNYCETLRELVVEKINEWLENNFPNKILYAIAIEEIDAWVLVIYDKKVTCLVNNPKSRLQYVLNKQDENSTSDYSNYLRLSKPLAKKKEVERGKFLDFNCSLRLFYEEVKSKLH